MSSIDNRVVEMEFNNRQFESGVSTTLKSLDNLKSGLKNLDGSNKTFDEIGSSAKKINLESLASNVQTIASRFSTLGVIATTALQNIANSAINTGKQLISSLSLDGIRDGFAEYELQMGSIQTILGNTKSKGTTLDQVNAALDELNTYADKTIYNFGQMTENIGRFTAAGVDLDKSVSSIKGISNLAALSGSTSAQAASAMYQLSQAIAAGKIQLMDWNSVVNAGMGGEQFQNALKRTAEHFGTNVDALIKKYGSFRESLTRGEWLTADVLTETLKQLSGAYTEADLINQGYTEDQAKAIVDLANTAEEAATKVRTFTQLIDTVKEAVGSGWAQSWRIVMGDFEEATALFTEINDVVSGFVGQQADARNALLQTWKDLGGRTDVIDGLRAGFEALSSVLGTVRDAFQRVFPPMTGEQLKTISQNFKDFMTNLKPAPETLDKISRAAEGFFSALDLVGQAISAVAKGIGDVFGGEGFQSLLDFFLDAAANIGDFFTELDKSAKQGKAFETLASIISNAGNTIMDVLSSITGKIPDFGDAFSKIGDAVGKAFDKVKEIVSNAVNWIKDNIGIDDIFAGFAGAGIFTTATKLGDLFDKVKDAIDKIPFLGDGGEEEATKFSDVLGTVNDALSSFTDGIKVGSLVAIAAAIALLSSALSKISEIKTPNITKSLGAIGIMFVELTAAFKSISKTLDKFDTTGMGKAAIAILAMAEAMKILADPVERLSKLDFDDLAKGLLGVGGGLAEMVIALRFLDGKNISLKTSVAMLALAKACEMLGDAMQSFSGLSWDEIARGLVSMGGALGELVAALSILSKVGGGGAILGSVGILIAVQSLEKISESLDELSDLSWDEIGRGLAAMGGALGELTIALGVLSGVGGFGALLGGAGILVTVQALKPIAETLDEISDLSWEEIAKGLVGMGGALGEVALFSGALGTISGISGLLGGGTILLAVQALKPISEALQEIGGMTWEEIAKGLVGMGGALAEVAGLSGVLGSVAGIAGLLGGGTILLAVQGLKPIAEALQDIGSMSWEEIARGLVGMGGALGELAVVSGATGALTGIAGLVGAGTIGLATQGLNELATALQKFGEMQWDEIGRGLAAMGGALGETALGGLLNTLSGFGAGAIKEIAEPLGTLADSVKKWEDVTVPEGLGLQLGNLAMGVQAFTLGGLGAGALAQIAEPLGTLANSVKRWKDVTVPEGLGEQLGKLADGVGKFTLSGMGASAIAEVASPLGALANSIKRWKDVTVPEGFGEKLGQIAEGVGKFTLSGFAAGGMAEIASPLGTLAGSVQSWQNVTIPEDFGKKLGQIATGVNGFTLSGFAAESMNSIVSPLSSLATSVSSWSNVTIPENFGTTLGQIASGVNRFTNAGVGETLSGVSTGLTSLATAMTGLAGVDFAGIGSNMSNFATTISTIPAQISGVAPQVSVAMSSIAQSISTSLSSITQAVSSAGVSITAAFGQLFTGAIALVASQAGALSSAGTTAVNGFIMGFTSALMAGSVQVTSILTAMFTTIQALSTAAFAALNVRFTTSGIMVMTSFAAAIASTGSLPVAAIRSVIQQCQAAATISSSAFYVAGLNMSLGLARGIAAGGSAAVAAATRVATNALKAAKAALDEHSPSKEFAKLGMFADLGLAKGFDDYANVAADSSVGVAKQTLSAMEWAMKDVDKTVGGQNISPNITPVVDYSDAMFKDYGSGRTISFKGNVNMDAIISSNAALAQSVAQEQQATRESNQRVIDAIGGLREDIQNYVNAESGDVNLYMDGKLVANTIAKPMNRKLQVLSKRGELK